MVLPIRTITATIAPYSADSMYWYSGSAITYFLNTDTGIDNVSAYYIGSISFSATGIKLYADMDFSIIELNSNSEEKFIGATSLFPNGTDGIISGNLSEITSSLSNVIDAFYLKMNRSGNVAESTGVYPRSGSVLTITINYVPIYSQCSFPSSLSVSEQTPNISSNIALSWSGASAGTSNAISGYKIYRSTSVGGQYSPLSALEKDITTSNSYGSITVVSPDTYGVSYYYKVKTIGSVTGYDSDLSSSYAFLTSTQRTACFPPSSVSANNSTPEPNSDVTIIWNAGAAGINNAVTGYILYRDVYVGGDFSTAIAEVDSTILSYATLSSPNENETYYYKVKTKGSAGTSYYSALSESYAQVTSTKATTSCGAPTSVTLSNESPSPLDSLTLNWSGATAGENNPISGYNIYEDTSQSGVFSTLTTTISSTETRGSYTVLAFSEYGIQKYYRIKTIGTGGGNSWLSQAVGYKTYLYADYTIDIPQQAILPEAIKYIVVYYDSTNVYKVSDNSIIDTVSKETILPCSGVYNDSTYHYYIVTPYSSSAYINSTNARALTETEQNFYVQNGDVRTTAITKQWTGTDWSTNVSTNVASWSQAASSQIIQNADSIVKKVSKGAIISEINQTAETVSILASKTEFTDGKNGKFIFGNATIYNTIPYALYCGGLVGQSSTATGISASNPDWAFWAGNGLFRVAQNGYLYAVNAYLSGLLKSGNWTFDQNGSIYNDNSGHTVTMVVGYDDRWATNCAKYTSESLNVIYGSDLSHNVRIQGNEINFYAQSAAQSASFLLSRGTYAYEDISFVCDQGGSGWDSAAGNLGTTDYRWDVLWARVAHYDSHPTTSSKYKKHDIIPIRDSGEILDSLTPVEFKYNDDPSERTRFGLIYEDTIDILPEICTEEKNGEKGIEYEYINMFLLEEVKKLRQDKKNLEKKITEQELRLSKLEEIILNN